MNGFNAYETQKGFKNGQKESIKIKRDINVRVTIRVRVVIDVRDIKSPFPARLFLSTGET